MPPLSEYRLPIDAPIEVVWRTLTDVATYGDWNPFVVRVEGTLDGIGSAFRLHVCWQDGSYGPVAGEVLTTFQPPAPSVGGVLRATFAYRYTGMLATLGLVRATRTQSLEQAPSGPTLYHTHEPFSGLFALFVPLARVRLGTVAMAHALRTQAEAANAATRLDRSM